MCFSEILIQKIKTANRIAVLTGAGISAESGVPTFRGKDGLWKKFRPEELATYEAFMRNPNLVWEWYNYRRKIISEVNPNPGHFALASMERLVPEFFLITQNVDGLHQRAGSLNVLELHGNIMRSRCVKCGKKSCTVNIEEKGEIPRCECGGLMGPDVVWFGEMLPQDVLRNAFNAAEKCDIFFSIGTSTVVQPAASLPMVAKRTGAFVVEINVEPTVISENVDETLIGMSGKILPKLLKKVWDIDISK